MLPDHKPYRRTESRHRHHRGVNLLFLLLVWQGLNRREYITLNSQITWLFYHHSHRFLEYL